MAKPITLRHKQLHLYDGGVYDNLGLEGFFDIAQQEKKSKTQRGYSFDCF